MIDQSFTATFSVDQIPQEVFEAINDVRGWWSEEIEGPTDKLGEEFTYRYENVHHCRIRVTELVPHQKVSWLVVDNYFDFVEDQSEWKSTTITFEISVKDGKTEVRFAHLGLVPERECFDVCSTAWGFYINSSLRSLITTGEGQPNRRGRPRLPAEELATARARQ